MALRTNPETLVAVAIYLGVAALIGFLGVRIRRGETSLIAGYQPESVDVEDEVARLVGNTTVALAAVTAVYAGAILLVEPSPPFWLSYLGVVAAAVTFVRIRGRRYPSRGSGR